MSEDFLGTGWAFPVLPDPTGGLRYAVGEDSIQDCLLVLLQTATGERVMRPDFGTTAPTLVFAPGSPANLRMLETSISDAIQRLRTARRAGQRGRRADPRRGKPGGRVGHLPDQADQHQGQPGVPVLPRQRWAGEPDDSGTAPAGRPDLGPDGRGDPAPDPGGIGGQLDPARAGRPGHHAPRACSPSWPSSACTGWTRSRTRSSWRS